jgi:hypothetical protein
MRLNGAGANYILPWANNNNKKIKMKNKRKKEDAAFVFATHVLP